MKKIQIFLSLLAVLTLLVDQSAQAQRRWSPQAKDAAIGAGIGGAAGAIINKRNRVVGGVIGGVVGGAAGYAIGKHTDNKRKEAARVAEANRVAAEREAARVAEANRVAAEREAANRAAEQSAVARANTERAPARATEGVNKAVRASGPVAVMATAPVATATAYTAPASPTPLVLKSGYLPNDTYGDQTAPYGMSPYRRKSW